MRLAPLQIESYALTDMTLRARQDFKPDRPLILGENDLIVTPGILPIKDQPQRWQVSLSVKLQPASGVNSPYEFSLNLIGIILWVAPPIPAEKLEIFIRTNGSTMIYGVAREMVRDLTAKGPFLPLLLPSVSFLPDLPLQDMSKAEFIEQTTKQSSGEVDVPKISKPMK